jgi:hypothetical protein
MAPVRPYFSCGRHENYIYACTLNIYACTLKPCDILKVKNTSVKGRVLRHGVPDL